MAPLHAQPLLRSDWMRHYLDSRYSTSIAEEESVANANINAADHSADATTSASTSSSSSSRPRRAAAQQARLLLAHTRLAQSCGHIRHATQHGVQCELAAEMMVKRCGDRLIESIVQETLQYKWKEYEMKQRQAQMNEAKQRSKVTPSSSTPSILAPSSMSIDASDLVATLQRVDCFAGLIDLLPPASLPALTPSTTAASTSASSSCCPSCPRLAEKNEAARVEIELRKQRPRQQQQQQQPHRPSEAKSNKNGPIDLHPLLVESSHKAEEKKDGDERKDAAISIGRSEDAMRVEDASACSLHPLLMLPPSIPAPSTSEDSDATPLHPFLQSHRCPRMDTASHWFGVS